MVDALSRRLSAQREVIDATIAQARAATAAEVREAEGRHIRRVLKHCGGHRANTAKILGISRKNLWEKMRELDVRDGNV